MTKRSFKLGDWVEAEASPSIQDAFWGAIVRGNDGGSAWCLVLPAPGQSLRGLKQVRASDLRPLSLLEILALEAMRMPGQTLIAPNYEELDGPSIFLAGPIQGADRWQDKAIEIIRALDPNVHILNPRRPTFVEVGFNAIGQYDWETFHLRRSAENGAIMFWCANEFEHVCTRSYAQTTRAELFEWKVHYERGQCNLVLGFDTNYSGSRYIRHRFGQDCKGLPIHDSLEATCARAVELAATCRVAD